MLVALLFLNVTTRVSCGASVQQMSNFIFFEPHDQPGALPGLVSASPKILTISSLVWPVFTCLAGTLGSSVGRVPWANDTDANKNITAIGFMSRY
jgi:hypothetical protein